MSLVSVCQALDPAAPFLLRQRRGIMCGYVIALALCLPGQAADEEGAPLGFMLPQVGTPQTANWAPADQSLKLALPNPIQSDPVLLWNEVVLETIRAQRTPPPVAARNLAIVHAAIFDAMNAIDGDYASYRFAGRAPDASPDVAAAVAAHRALVELYPGRAGTFDRELETLLAGIADGTSKLQGMWLGRQAAEAILEERRNDGADLRLPYQPALGPGSWNPTPPEYLPALLPHWRLLTCFCMPGAAQLRPLGPPALNEAVYAQSFIEVRGLGALNSNVRTPEQTEIALFWADDVGTVTPPGHWNRIAQDVARSHRTTTLENARLFALLNLALADAAIACWDCKYHYGFWRPVQAIRMTGSDRALAGDPGWTPLLRTPPFPSYVSGHSTFSGAAAAVLAKFFGSDRIPFTVKSEGGMRGLTRSFSSFSTAAQEAGRSRIYGGIHWEFDNADGLALGRSMGEHVAGNFLVPAASFQARK
jgi:membrane-associated phospholipid phosphatase